LLVGGLLTACNGTEGTGGKGFVSGDGQLTVVDPADRGAPVTLTGEDLDGHAVDLADFRGKPLVVNLWWSACGPCRAEAPILERAAKDLGSDAAFLGVNIRDTSAANGQSFVRRFKVTYPSLYSPDGTALLAFRGNVPANAIPSTLVLDADGRIAAKVIGQVHSVRTLVDIVRDEA
jgi:thiol-disulfide isomerase/thioredoxin